jgi:hypothetical protein
MTVEEPPSSPEGSPRPPGSSRWQRLSQPAALLALLAMGCSFCYAWRAAQRCSGIDFYHFWTTARGVAQRQVENPYSAGGREKLFLEVARKASAKGLSPFETLAAKTIFEIDSPKRRMHTVASLLLFAVIRPFSFGDAEGGYKAFTFVSNVCFLLAVLLLCRLLGYSLPAALLVPTILLAWHGPFLNDLGVGNVGRLQFAVAAVAVWLQGKGRAGPLLGGLTSGLLVVFKPNILLVAAAVALVWLVNRRFRTVALNAAGAAIGAAAGLCLAALFFGSFQCWKDWLAILPEVLASVRTVADGNTGLANLLLAATARDFSHVLLAILLLLLAVTAWLGRRRGQSPAAPSSPSADNQALARETLLAAGIGSAIMLLSARLVWPHYFVLSIPLVLIALAPADPDAPPDSGAGRRILAVLALLCQTHLFALLRLHRLFGADSANVLGTMLLLGGAFVLLSLWNRPAGPPAEDDDEETDEAEATPGQS